MLPTLLSNWLQIGGFLRWLQAGGFTTVTPRTRKCYMHDYSFIIKETTLEVKEEPQKVRPGKIPNTKLARWIGVHRQWDGQA